MKNFTIKHLSLLLFLFITIGANAQTPKMERNRNLIDEDFIPSIELKNRFKKLKNNKKDITLYLEKEAESTYTIYIYNNSSDSLTISNQDAQVYLIQEAKDKNREWKPIEYWIYSWCGNSYHFTKLEPNGIMKTESKVYQGDFKTTIRFKLLNNNKVYFSNSTLGYVNLSQFKFPEEEISKYPTYKNYKARGGIRLLKKIMFLEPNGMKEFIELEKAFNKKVKQKNKKKSNGVSEIID